MDAQHHGLGPVAALAASVNYRMLAGYVFGGWLMARAALAAASGAFRDDFLTGKITTAAFYAEQILPKAAALSVVVCSSSSFAERLPVEQF